MVKKMVEMLKDAAKYEEIMFKEYINLLKEKEEKKSLKNSQSYKIYNILKPMEVKK